MAEQPCLESFYNPSVIRFRHVFDGSDMTVCIAGICSWAYEGEQTIVAICDRMITSTDVQFEPDQPKLFPFTSRIGALISGSGATQTAICSAVKLRPEVANGWNDISITVESVANFFAQDLARYRARHAEQIYLRPLGIDTATFMENQNSYQSQFVQGYYSQHSEFRHWGNADCDHWRGSNGPSSFLY